MLLLYALARPIASSLSASSINLTSFDPVTGECIDINGCRTTTGILWSCLSVIFICTWVAIHPNIPKVQDKEAKPWNPAVVIYQNVELMVVALLAPEFMILWAMRQREKAKKIGEQFKNYGWGMPHGFFVIMGGFVLFDEGEFRGPLWEQGYNGYEDEIAEHHQHMKEAPSYKRQRASQPPSHSTMPLIVEAASTPEEGEHNTSVSLNSSDSELWDLHWAQEKPSKSIDKPSDASCLLEFFVANGYITLTEDEIKDKSHADFITKSIAVIQTIWFIMQVIARAIEGLAITELEIITVGFAILNFGTYFLWWNKPLRVRHPVRVYWRQTEKSGAGETDGGKAGFWGACWEGAGAIVEYIHAIGSPVGDTPYSMLIRLLLLPLWIPLHIFYVCLEILKDEDDSNLAIPISSRLHDDPLHLYIAVYGIAALFGTIHCIPWVFQFPTHTEQLLWRISAVAVAVAPVAMGVLHGYEKSDVYISEWLVQSLIIILSFAYAVFRIALLVIAFTALRDLHPSAYQTVQWTTFIPHIG
ncbi:hypothetical protein VNI00_014906 [Paramarasmius palmivorus]|uniref:Uncharacterized protein n=1 Tax=Paramarasmius palmivorus TaxID=297713 RepID=A0AAW0BN68_9AGAR